MSIQMKQKDDYNISVVNNVSEPGKHIEQEGNS